MASQWHSRYGNLHYGESGWYVAAIVPHWSRNVDSWGVYHVERGVNAVRVFNAHSEAKRWVEEGAKA